MLWVAEPDILSLRELTLARSELGGRRLVEVVEGVWVFSLQALLALGHLGFHVHHRIVPILGVLMIGLGDCVSRVCISAALLRVVRLLRCGGRDCAPVSLTFVQLAVFCLASCRCILAARVFLALHV